MRENKWGSDFQKLHPFPVIGPIAWGFSQCLKGTLFVFSTIALVSVLPLVYRDNESPPIGQGGRLWSGRTKT